MTRKHLLMLPLINADTKVVHSTKTEIDGEPAYSFEVMTASEYAKRFNVPLLSNGWPNGMSVMDMSLSLEAIDKECADRFIDSLFRAIGGDSQ